MTFIPNCDRVTAKRVEYLGMGKSRAQQEEALLVVYSYLHIGATEYEAVSTDCLLFYLYFHCNPLAQRVSPSWVPGGTMVLFPKFFVL